MKIAVLSFGSLIHSGRNRGLETDEFKSDGPILPIEFSRISQKEPRKDCLTAVIDPINGHPNIVQYALSHNKNLDKALKNLRLVENAQHIGATGYINLLNNKERNAYDTIRPWAELKGFDAVIWTSLKANFESISGNPFTIPNALSYITNLKEPTRTKTIDYILNCPIISWLKIKLSHI